MIGSVTTYGGLSLTQAAMTYAVSPSAGSPSADDQSQTSPDGPQAQQIAASDIALTPASMSALIAAQASLSQDAPALIRRHTAQDLGEMIWGLYQDPPLSPAPMAVRRLQAAQAALNASLVDLQA